MNLIKMKERIKSNRFIIILIAIIFLPRMIIGFMGGLKIVIKDKIKIRKRKT
jgi:hypothetical protein